MELNKAVLYSYKKAGVTIVDHFTQVNSPIGGRRRDTDPSHRRLNALRIIGDLLIHTVGFKAGAVPRESVDFIP